MANKIRAILVQPGEKAMVTEISNELEDLQRVVGGYIEVAHLLEDEESIVICNEEGKLMGLPPCRTILGSNGNPIDVIFGSFLIAYAKWGDEDFSSLPDDLLKKYLEMFQAPEVFV